MNDNYFLLLLDLIGLCSLLALAAWIADFLEKRQTPRWLNKIFEFLGN